MKRIIKQSVAVFGLSLVMMGVSPVWAESSSSVQTRLEAEYLNGKVGSSTYTDLKDILALGQSAASIDDQATAVESYNALLEAQAGSTVDAEAAARLRFQ